MPSEYLLKCAMDQETFLQNMMDLGRKEENKKKKIILAAYCYAQNHPQISPNPCATIQSCRSHFLEAAPTKSRFICLRCLHQLQFQIAEE